MFRFSIRELMLVTMIVALAVAWWMDRYQLSEGRAWRQRAAVIEQYLVRNHWEVWWGVDSVGITQPDGAYQFAPLDDSPPSTVVSDDFVRKSARGDSPYPESPRK